MKLKKPAASIMPASMPQCMAGNAPTIAPNVGVAIQRPPSSIPNAMPAVPLTCSHQGRSAWWRAHDGHSQRQAGMHANSIKPFIQLTHGKAPWLMWHNGTSEPPWARSIRDPISIPNPPIPPVVAAAKSHAGGGMRKQNNNGIPSNRMPHAAADIPSSTPLALKPRSTSCPAPPKATSTRVCPMVHGMGARFPMASTGFTGMWRG